MKNGPATAHTPELTYFVVRRFVLGVAIWTALACAAPSHAVSTNTAQARLYCESIYLASGTENSGEYHLLVSGLSEGVNNELFPTGGTYSHGAYAYLEDQFFGGYIPGTLSLAVPSLPDSNKDGFPDFFDTSRAISGTSRGSYSFPGISSGSIDATWSRGQSNATGAVTLRLKQNNLVVWKTFTHTFLIMEYRGKATYTPGTSAVSSGILMEQTDFPGNLMGGPFHLQKSSTNKYNLLLGAAQTWTNSAEATFRTIPTEMVRETTWPTNYYGWLEFEDGDPNTAEPDFTLWTLTIDDLNDSDGDKIPDFSDDPAAPSAPAKLEFRLVGSSAHLVINGTPGKVYSVQSKTNLLSGNWLSYTNVTLSTARQNVNLPAPSGGQRFWRVFTN